MNPNIKTQANCQVQGYFKLSAVQGDADGNPIPGTERELTDWFPNLITDNGMELLKGPGFLNYIMVGSGSTAPAKTDTTLGAFVAGMAGTASKGPSDFTPVDYPWCSAQTTCQFAKGAAAGNLSELGVGISQTNMFARSLIKDTSGNPTTITVTSIELLTVTYQWRVYFDLTYSHQDQFTIDGTTYTTTTMAGLIRDDFATGWNINGFNDSGGLQVNASTGAVGSPGSNPAGTYLGALAATNTMGAAGQYYRDVSLTVSESQWNDNITAFVTVLPISGAYNACLQKVGVSPALAKNNNKTLNLTIRVSWARKVP